MKITDNALITMQEHREEVIQMYGESEETETFQKAIELLMIIKEKDQEKLKEYMNTIPEYWYHDLNDLQLLYMNAFQFRYPQIEYNLDIIDYLAKEYGRI